MKTELAAPLVTRTLYAALAVLEAIWPRSTAARETKRLARDGHEVGATYDVDFSVSIDPADADAASAAVRAAGFAVVERVGTKRVYLVARGRMPLRAFHLSRAVALLDRTVAPFEGFATFIAPVARVPDVAGTIAPMSSVTASETPARAVDAARVASR